MWHLYLYKEKQLSPRRLIEKYQAGRKSPIALVLDHPILVNNDEQDVLALLEAVHRYDGLTVLVLDCPVSSWLVALTAAFDMAIATNETSLSLEGLSGSSLDTTAEFVSRALGKIGAMEFLLAGTMTAARAHELGLIFRIIDREELKKPKTLVDRIFPGFIVETVPKLKRIWRGGNIASREDHLAAERKEFASCFQKGAPQSIAEYLNKMLDSKKRK